MALAALLLVSLCAIYIYLGYESYDIRGGNFESRVTEFSKFEIRSIIE
jgi:hypothetical protein